MRMWQFARDDSLVSLDWLRVDIPPPRELGIHSAIPTAATTIFRPMSNAISISNCGPCWPPKLPDRGNFVVMVGGSSAGKTRSLYEAIYELVPDWALALPARRPNCSACKYDPPHATVFWLDELQQYLGTRPALTFECVRRCCGTATSWSGRSGPTSTPDGPPAATTSTSLVKSAFAIPVRRRSTGRSSPRRG